jgi:F-type H+-transporting ATPase subunit delta
MKVNTKAYAIALYETIKENKGEQLKIVLRNFVLLLAKKNLLSSAKKILADFSRYYNEAEGIVEVRVQTAKALSAENKEKMIHQLKSRLGKEIDLKSEIDASLLGGIILQVNDTQFDGSLKRQLDLLKKDLIS